MNNWIADNLPTHIEWVAEAYEMVKLESYLKLQENKHQWKHA